MALIGSKRIGEFILRGLSKNTASGVQISSNEWTQMVVDKLGITIEHEIEKGSSLVNTGIDTNENQALFKRSQANIKD